MGQPRSGELSGIVVLVVEDDEDALHILGALLTYLGAFVLTAASAEHALHQLAQVRSDVVVCDVNLGDHDALWLIEHARTHQPATPFIAVSGQDHDELAMRRAGFTASFTKPVQHDRLVGAIQRATRH